MPLGNAMASPPATQALDGVVHLGGPVGGSSSTVHRRAIALDLTKTAKVYAAPPEAKETVDGCSTPQL